MGRLLLLIIWIFLTPVLSAEEQTPAHCPLKQQEPAVSGPKSQLLVFISFSMPKQSLEQWARQTTQAGGTLVLRGFKNNSLKQTLVTAKEVLGKEGAQNLIIDPDAFTHFKIQAVPTVVLVEKHNQQNPEAGEVFDMLQGNVSLKYALQEIQKKGELARVAELYLKRLQS